MTTRMEKRDAFRKEISEGISKEIQTAKNMKVKKSRKLPSLENLIKEAAEIQQIPSEEVNEAILIAHIRHSLTNYERLIKSLQSQRSASRGNPNAAISFDAVQILRAKANACARSLYVEILNK